MITINSYIVCEKPKISVVPNFFSISECEHLIAVSEKIGFTRSLVGRGLVGELPYDESHLTNQCSPNRTSSSVLMPHSLDDQVTAIEHKLAELAKIDLVHLESLVVVKYESGQEFKIHHDGVFRSRTIFVYLNDGACGGETRFPALELRIKPCRGTAVMWDNGEENTDHAGLPPEGWTKYGVNCFFNKSIMK